MSLLKIFILLTGLCYSHVLFAQDIHFSEFYASPLLVNPAKTGFITGDYRVTGIYRNQWQSITVPYTTISASFDGSFVPGKRKNNFFGVGFTLFNDKAGDSQFNTTEAAFSAAYHRSVDRFQTQYLSFGLMAGYVSSSINFQNLKWDEQFEGGALTESFPATRSSYADLSAGVEYTWLSNKNTNINVGLSVYHANQPVQSFFGDNASVVFRKYVLNAGLSFPMGTRFTGFPKVYYALQGTYQEMVAGFLTRYNFKGVNEKTDYGIYGGFFIRWNDAFIFTTRFELNNLAIGFSYDVNFSRLTEVSHSEGGPELSLLYTGSLPNLHHKTIYCPRF